MSDLDALRASYQAWVAIVEEHADGETEAGANAVERHIGIDPDALSEAVGAAVDSLFEALHPDDRQKLCVVMNMGFDWGALHAKRMVDASD